MKIYFAWTPERDQQVREMAAQLMSARQIANAIGAPSRNSVISRASRAGITLLWRTQITKIQRDRVPKPTMSGQQAGAVIVNMRRRSSVSRVYVEPVVIAPVDSKNIPLLALARNACRFPTSPDDAPSHLFCGAVKREGSSYCGHHFAICHQPPKHRKVAV